MMRINLNCQRLLYSTQPPLIRKQAPIIVPRKIESIPIDKWPVLLPNTSNDPPQLTAIKLKSRSQPNLLNPVSTLSDGTTIHLNPDAFEYKFTPSNLPPYSSLFTTDNPKRQMKDLSDNEKSEIVALRTESPEVWTVRALAKKFGVSTITITMLVKCPKPRLDILSQEKQARFDHLPLKAKQSRIDRERRRLLW